MIDKIKEEEKNVRKAVKERMVTSVLAALGLVIGLAWNDAIKSAIEAIFPSSGSGILAKFVYALVLTFFVAILAYYVSRFFTEKTENK